MSRLTKIDANGNLLAYLKHNDGLPAIITKGHPCYELVLKLNTYQDIGEPEELVKPVRCKDCKHLNKPECATSFLTTSADGNRIYYKTSTGDEFYCSDGRIRELSKSQFRRIELQKEGK